VAWGSFSDKPDYQPDSKGIVLKMVYEQGSRRLLGLQAVGRGDICRRIDVFASFLQHRATVDDLLNFEHGYAPPFSEALDPLYHLASIACAQDRDAAFVSPASNFEGREGEQVLILDVREEVESTAAPLPVGIAGHGVATAQIPLGQLKCRLAELDPQKRIVVICQRGSRSYQAMSILQANSFRNVAILAGGLLARGDRHLAPGREDGS
jgi:rhodanese-related sulfurtransferase